MPTVSESFAEIEQTLRNLKAIDIGLSPAISSMTADEYRSFLAESIFMRSWREFEQYVHKIFIAYCMGEISANGKAVPSFVKPKDEAHMERILRGSSSYIDWNDLERIVTRAEMFLEDGGPIKTAITTSGEAFKEAKAIRNHIAHNSRDSYLKFEGVVTSRLRTRPVNKLTAGGFLLLIDRGKKPQIYLETYIDHLHSLSDALANVP